MENEIREFDEPGVIQMTASDLRQLNAQLAEDLKLLAEKFPNSSPRATPPTPNKELDKIFNFSFFSRVEIMGCVQTETECSGRLQTAILGWQ